MQMKSTNALVKVREAFVSAEKPLTLSEIRETTKLASSSISMALCHLRRQRYVTRELIANETQRARKTVWSYSYHPDRLPES